MESTSNNILKHVHTDKETEKTPKMDEEDIFNCKNCIMPTCSYTWNRGDQFDKPRYIEQVNVNFLYNRKPT